VAPGGHAAVLGQGDQQPNRLVRDPVLGVVQVDALGLADEALAARRVAREEVAEVQIPHLLRVRFERRPGRALAQGGCGSVGHRGSGPDCAGRPGGSAGRSSTQRSQAWATMKSQIGLYWKLRSRFETSSGEWGFTVGTQ